MLLDFEVGRCTRRCVATGRELAPGEICYSVLQIQGAEVLRADFCREAWSGAPASSLGWWKTTVPEPAAKRIRLAPNEVLLQLFDELADRDDQRDLRYVLTLLLIRRRVFRLDVPVESDGRPRGAAVEAELLLVYCPKRDAAYAVPVIMPERDRIDAIQRQLSDLLIAGAD